MSFNGETVPVGFWFCGSCKNPNQIALAPVQCSACGHTRDGCCSEAGAPKPLPAGMYIDSTYYDSSAADMVGLSPYGAQQQSWNTQYNPHATGPQFPTVASNPHFVPCNTASGTDAGSWYCPECNAANSSLTNFCPLCGATKPK